MSDKGAQEKTEQPTDHRLQQLRQKGSIPKSRDLASSAALLGVMLVIWFAWPFFFNQLGDLILMPIQYFDQPFESAIRALMQSSVKKFAIIILPIVGLAVPLAIVAHMVQFGFIFAADPVKPEMNRINPFEGFKNLFSFSRLMEAIKSVVKTVLLLSALWLVLQIALPTLVMLNHYGLNGVLRMTGRLLGQISVLCIIIFITISFFDVFIQKKIFRHENKMSKDEVKREWKEIEGDPQIKGKRKQLFRDLITSPGSIPTDVAKATVVITNPTHFAVALYYCRGITDLPVVIAKGMDEAAAKIILIARRAGVPVVQNPPVARSLFHTVELRDFIGSELVIPVAEILARCISTPFTTLRKQSGTGVGAKDSWPQQSRTDRIPKQPIKKGR